MRLPAPAMGALVVLVLAQPTGAAANDVSSHGKVATIRAVRSPESIRVDGKLDDVAWSLAVAATHFRQRDPDEGAAPTERTELRGPLVCRERSTVGHGRYPD